MLLHGLGLLDLKPLTVIMVYYRLLVWIDEPLAQDRVTSDLRLRIWDIFQQRGIAMTAPDHLRMQRL